MSSANAPEPAPQPLTGSARLKSYVPKPVKRGLRRGLRALPPALGGSRSAPTTGPVVDITDPRWSDRPHPGDASARVIIGPANIAGQAYAWCRALEASASDASAISFQVDAGGPFNFPSDFHVPVKVYRRNAPWEQAHLDWVTGNFTHAFIEAGKPLFGDLLMLDVFKEHDALTAKGVVTGMIAHGSELRSPERHAEQYPWSPYRDKDWNDLDAIRRKVHDFAPKLAAYEGRVFVSTPDLVEDRPDASWLPVTVDPMKWPPTAIRERDVLRVVHAASHRRIKGTQGVERQLAGLIKSKQVELILLERESPATVRENFARADIVLDQFRLGSYGVAAVEAMMCGRVVVGNVVESVRERVWTLTGERLPIVQASPKEIGDVVADLVSDPDRVRELGAVSAKFARAVHGGALSGAILRDAVGAMPRV